METKKLIDWLQGLYTHYVEYEVPMEEREEEIIEEITTRLERYDALKSMNEGLLDFLESVSNTLKSRANNQ